jgi:hypothetical protein
MTKMSFVENDDVIKAISADGSDQSFRESIIKSSQLHLFRLIERRPSGSLMSSIPYTGVSSRS